MTFAARTNYQTTTVGPYLNHPRTISSSIYATSVTVSFTVKSDGTITATGLTIDPTPDSAEWVNGLTPSEWQVRFTKTSGVDPNYGSATLNTWLPCTSNLFLAVSASNNTTRSGVFTVSFRKAGTTAPVYDFPGLTLIATAVGVVAP